MLRQWALGAERSNGIHSPLLCLAQQSIVLPHARLKEISKINIGWCHSLPNTTDAEGKYGNLRTTL